MNAVILAAGMGTRLREHHHLPKGLIRINELSLIEESIDILRSFSIENILLVTGYGAEHYVPIVEKYDNVSSVYNQDYEQTGSLYSLYCAHKWASGPFLLLESDILYERSAIKQLIDTTASCAIAVSEVSHSEDEVFVQARNTYLTTMSKALDTLRHEQVMGEFVGISKLSLESYQLLLTIADKNPALLHSGHYETDGLVQLATRRPIRCVHMPNLAWCEIDTAEHLAHAKKIYQRTRIH